MICEKCTTDFVSQPHQLNDKIVCNSCFEIYENKRRELLRQYENELKIWLTEFFESKATIENTELDYAQHPPDMMFG